MAGSAEECLSALFVDFDNVYLSLRRQNEEAAGRFARNPKDWLTRIASGGLIRFKSEVDTRRRRFAVARCYGNPGRKQVSRGGPHDPHNFASVRANFMIAGLEVVDCQPLSSQFKNGTDIKIACDIRDYLEHPTRFGEFIILSGDADFTPVLHHLRSHDRRTVVYANENTAEIYKAFSDGWIDECDMVNFLLEETRPALAAPEHSGMEFAGAGARGLSHPGRGQAQIAGAGADTARPRLPAANSAVQSLIEDFRAVGSEIIALVVETVRASDRPVPIAFLADRAQKMLGHAKTIGTNWAGTGGFLTFLNNTLPEPLRLSDRPPHFVYDPTRHRIEERSEMTPVQAIPQKPQILHREPSREGSSSRLTELQNSITRIYEACKAPPFPPSEYQLLFNLIATEVHERGFSPIKTAQAVVARAHQEGLKIPLRDVAFILDAVDEIDPWLEQTRSPAAVARAYRDFVLARCRQAGVVLTDEEHQLVQVWFGASQWPVGQSTLRSVQPLQRPQLGRSQRSFMVESALPPPDPRGDVSLPGDLGFDRDLDMEQNQKSASQRFDLKH